MLPHINTFQHLKLLLHSEKQMSNPLSPQKLAHLENIHIPLWLFKDTCWMLHFKLLGTLLILPTVTVALVIAWKTRKEKHLFYPNLGVAFWICANSIWMAGEFFELPFLIPSLVLFIGGITIVLYHFWLVYRGKSVL